jgi:hypothetical protein
VTLLIGFLIVEVEDVVEEGGIFVGWQEARWIRSGGLRRLFM